MRVCFIRHAFAPLFAFTICTNALAQNQSIADGCGANVGSVSGNVSITIDCGSSKTDQLSVQYVRLFGAAEVPLLMTLFGRPEITSRSPWGRQFRTVLSPEGDESIVGTNLIGFFNRYSFRNARPLLTTIWSDVARNERAPSAIQWLATAGARAERICYFDTQEADSSGYYSGLLVERKLVPNESWCKPIVRRFDRRVGFTFIVIENDSSKPLTDVQFLVRQNYTTNDVMRADVTDLPEYLEKKLIDTLPERGAPQANLVVVYGAASDTENSVRQMPVDWIFAARVEPKEKIIALLDIYVANERNLPAAYLSGIYTFDEIKYSIDGVSKSMKVRPPSLGRAARIMVPYGWASQ